MQKFIARFFLHYQKLPTHWLLYSQTCKSSRLRKPTSREHLLLSIKSKADTRIILYERCVYVEVADEYDYGGYGGAWWPALVLRLDSSPVGQSLQQTFIRLESVLVHQGRILIVVETSAPLPPKQPSTDKTKGIVFQKYRMLLLRNCDSIRNNYVSLTAATK